MTVSLSRKPLDVNDAPMSDFMNEQSIPRDIPCDLLVSDSDEEWCMHGSCDESSEKCDDDVK